MTPASRFSARPSSGSSTRRHGPSRTTPRSTPSTDAFPSRSTPSPGRTGGWLIRTDRAVLRYKIGSGPFTAVNTSLQLSVAGHLTTVRPTWEWECTFGQVCQAGAASLGGGASLGQPVQRLPEHGRLCRGLPGQGGQRHLGRPGGRGGPGPAGHPLHQPPHSAASRPCTSTIDLEVDGHLARRWPPPRPPRPQPWSTLTATATLRAGTNTVRLVSLTTDSFDLGVDTLSVGPAGAAAPAPAETGPLGGWIRGFDTDTYNENPTCGPGQAGATCQAGIEPLNTDGLLDTAGWRLLDDTHTAVWTGSGWVKPRPGRRRPPGRVPVRLRPRLHRRPAHAGPAHRSGSAAHPQRLRRLVLRLHPLFEHHHRAFALPGVRRQPRSPQCPVPRHRLEGAQRLERLGVERPALPRPRRRFCTGPRLGGSRSPSTCTRASTTTIRSLPAAQRIAGHRLASSTCTNGPCKVWDWSSDRRPSPTSPCSRPSSVKASPSGGWTGAATTRWRR